MQSQARSSQESGEMLTLAITLIGSFVIMAVLTETDDDDNSPGGGLMTPIYAPSNNGSYIPT